MYKAIQNKKYYLALHTFKKTAKYGDYNIAYKDGCRKIHTTDGTMYVAVIGTFRIIFRINKPEQGTCNC